MLNLVSDSSKRYTLTEAIRADVSARLYDAFSAEDGALSNLDRWTQRKVAFENLAKIDLTLEADDPVEYCHQNLIREIDSEAEYGIYLFNDAIAREQLVTLTDDAGISGDLGLDIDAVAPTLFADEFAHSDESLDLVWITIRARYGRARIDALASEVIMGFLLDDAEIAGDMSHALRAMLYSSHEDVTRRLCGLDPQLRERGSKEIAMMVSELRDRAGDYYRRADEISRRADT